MRLRAPSHEDAPAVLGVVVARDVIDLGMPDYALEDIYDAWGVSSFDLAVDAVIAETDEGAIAGYAAVEPKGTMVVVAPEHEGSGVGARLLEWAERRDRELGRRRHRQGIAAGNSRARALLRNAGYERSRSYWRLERHLDDLGDAAAPAGELRLRSLSVEGDATAVHALSETSFAGNADYRRESLVSFCEAHLEPHDFDPRLSLLAEEGDSLVGFLLARRWDEEGVCFVDLLGVHPEHRRRGIATTLLRTAFAQFASAGLDRAQLGVASDNPDALRLYERCGMSPRFTVETYERPVRPEGD